MSASVPDEYRKRLDRLVVELDELHQRGGPGRVFIDLEDSGPLDLPVLFDVVQLLYPRMWADEGQHVDAIKRVLADAIQALPTHNLPETHPKTMSWQEAARILFNVKLPPEAATAIQDGKGRESAKLRRYVRDMVAFPETDNPRQDDRRFQNIVLEMRKLMAESVFKLVSDDGNEEQREPLPEAAESTGTPTDSELAATEYRDSGTIIHKVEGQVYTGNKLRVRNELNFGDRRK